MKSDMDDGLDNDLLNINDLLDNNYRNNPERRFIFIDERLNNPLQQLIGYAVVAISASTVRLIVCIFFPELAEFFHPLDESLGSLKENAAPFSEPIELTDEQFEALSPEDKQTIQRRVRFNRYIFGFEVSLVYLAIVLSSFR